MLPQIDCVPLEEEVLHLSQRHSPLARPHILNCRLLPTAHTSGWPGFGIPLHGMMRASDPWGY